MPFILIIFLPRTKEDVVSGGDFIRLTDSSFGFVAFVAVLWRLQLFPMLTKSRLEPLIPLMLEICWL